MRNISDPQLNTIISDVLWRTISNGQPWTIDQMFENLMLSELVVEYMASENKADPKYQAIIDEAEDWGLTVDDYCTQVLSNAERYRRCAIASRRARTMILNVPDIENHRLDAVSGLIEQHKDALIAKYVTYDES